MNQLNCPVHTQGKSTPVAGPLSPQEPHPHLSDLIFGPPLLPLLAILQTHWPCSCLRTFAQAVPSTLPSAFPQTPPRLPPSPPSGLCSGVTFTVRLFTSVACGPGGRRTITLSTCVHKGTFTDIVIGIHPITTLNILNNPFPGSIFLDDTCRCLVCCTSSQSSQCGPRPGSLSFAGELAEMLTVRPHPRQTELGPLGGGPSSLCGNSPPGCPIQLKSENRCSCVLFTICPQENGCRGLCRASCHLSCTQKSARDGGHAQ